MHHFASFSAYNRFVVLQKMGPKKTQQADFCPILSNSILSCQSSQPDFNETNLQPVDEEYFGKESRCINSNFGRPLCLQSFCDDDLGVIWLVIGGAEIKCSHDNQIIDIELSGQPYQIECPKKAVFCPNMVCPSDCRGREICNWDLPMPKCQEMSNLIKTMSNETVGNVTKSNETNASELPSISPTEVPSAFPSGSPTISSSPTKSALPSEAPSMSPSESPIMSSSPTKSSAPTKAPSYLIIGLVSFAVVFLN